MVTKHLTALKEDLAFRAVTLDDLEAAVDLFNACSRAMIGREDFLLSDIRNDWLTPGFNLAGNTRMAVAPDGELVGYIEVWDLDNPPAIVHIWGRVHPDYEGQGIGLWLHDWAFEKAQQALDRVPSKAQVAIRSNTLSTHQPAVRLLEAVGMTPIRHYYRMVVDLDQPPPRPRWPEGITVRSYDHQKDAEAVYRADEKAFRDHFGHMEVPFEEGFRRWIHWIEGDEMFDPSLWFLALDGEEIAGLAICRPQSYEDVDSGLVNSLAVRRPWRKRGLGLALLHQAFGEFYRRGKTSACLGVDAGNLTGALGLYERAGMRPHRRYDTYEKVLRPGIDLSKR